MQGALKTKLCPNAKLIIHFVKSTALQFSRNHCAKKNLYVMMVSCKKRKKTSQVLFLGHGKTIPGKSKYVLL